MVRISLICLVAAVNLVYAGDSKRSFDSIKSTLNTKLTGALNEDRWMVKSSVDRAWHPSSYFCVLDTMKSYTAKSSKPTIETWYLRETENVEKLWKKSLTVGQYDWGANQALDSDWRRMASDVDADFKSCQASLAKPKKDTQDKLQTCMKR